MDMLPEKENESPEPGDEARETPVTEEPGAVETPEPEAQPQQIVSESPVPPATPGASPRRPTFDEAVGEMRQSLREEETKAKTGFGFGVRRFVQRIFRRRTAPLPEVTEARLDEFATPEAPPVADAVSPAGTASGTPATSEATVEAPQVPPEQEQPSTESSTFHKLVRNKMTGALPGLDSIEPLVAPQEPGLQEEVAPQVNATEDEALEFLAPGQSQLKEQTEEPAQPQSILQAVRGEAPSEPEDVSSMRQAALEDYVTAPSEEDVTEAAPLPRRLRRGWRDMRPIDRTLLTGALAIIAVVFVGGTGMAIYETVKPTPTVPPATPTTSVTPIPTSLSLPGGWVFPLKTGTVGGNGVWDPAGAEWLQGTEICRWVSLPYTVQLEAVLRTLKADDPVQLTMSDTSSIIFKVKSIQQKAPNEIQSIAPSTPSLLIILSKQDSPLRWVVVAEP